MATGMNVPGLRAATNLRICEVGRRFKSATCDLRPVDRPSVGESATSFLAKKSRKSQVAGRRFVVCGDTLIPEGRLIPGLAAMLYRDYVFPGLRPCSPGISFHVILGSVSGHGLPGWLNKYLSSWEKNNVLFCGLPQ